MEGNSAFYDFKKYDNMTSFNATALLETLQQFTAAICGVYYNEDEKVILIVRPWTGDSEDGLFNTLFFNNDGVAQLRVVVETYSENLFREQSNDLISFNTLTKSFQTLDLESYKGELDGFSKTLNYSKKLWGFQEFQEILKEFLNEEFPRFNTKDKIWIDCFPNKTVLVLGYDKEEKRYKLFFRERSERLPKSWIFSDEEEAKKKVSKFIKLYILQPIKETVE